MRLHSNSDKKNKFGILISDGNYNRGEDPVKFAKKFPALHVIGMPADKDSTFYNANSLASSCSIRIEFSSNGSIINNNCSFNRKYGLYMYGGSFNNFTGNKELLI